MKITINLTDAEAAGIIEYLEQVTDIVNPTKKDIQSEIQNIVSGNLHCEKEAVSSYINLAEHKLSQK